MAEDYLIGEIMVQNVVTGKSHHTIFECSRKMSDNNVGCLVITDDGSVLGILTEQDISRKVVSGGLDPKSTPVSVVMSTKVESIHPEKGMREAVQLMGTNEIKHLPVIEGGKLVGIITAKDIVVLEPILMDKISLNGKSRRDDNWEPEVSTFD